MARVWHSRSVEPTPPPSPSASASAGEPRPPARFARETTRDNPWPLRLLSHNIKTYVDKMSALWVEGQIVQFNRRGATQMSFFTLRDVDEDVSMDVTAFGSVMAKTPPTLAAGARVVARVKPVFWTRSGRLNLQAEEILPVGVGDLLAQIEMLRQRLAAEGLFDSARKKPLPFLPRTIGLVCGRNAKAKDDVIVNATARWPGARFEVREVLVQGAGAVAGVTGAVRELDALDRVDVIVIARGGGSVEDLLPFSDEAIVRCVAEAHTPIVSAIGHEGDAPLVDFAADFRASTPTDAAKTIVPHVADEREGLTGAVQRMRHAVRRTIDQERHQIAQLRERPVFAHPERSLDSHFTGLERATTAIRHAVRHRLATETSALAGLSATLRAVSPQGTLERGYSILKAPGVGVLTDASLVSKGAILEAQLARGSMIVTVFGTNSVAPGANATTQHTTSPEE